MADTNADDMIKVRTGQIVLVQDSKGLGTGLVVGDDGWVLTNRHVAPSVGPYRVVLSSGKNVHAVGVHQSNHHDLAIVKVDLSHEAPFDIENDLADAYHVGEEVWALGHPRGCRFSVSRGIISNPHREIDGDYYVQTDVAINPGNSGGPLVDSAGRLVGVVTLMYAGSQGLGFAVPAHTASDYVRLVRRLVRQGVVKIPMELLAKTADKEQVAPEIVRSAVDVLMQIGDASVEEENAESGHFKIRKKKGLIDVVCSNEVLTVRGRVSMLGKEELDNGAFLTKLLRLNGTAELGGASFHLDGDALELGIRRPTTGLDALEAFWAMDLVLHLLGEWSGKINELAYSSPSPKAGAAKPESPFPQIAMPKPMPEE
ncbi:MAG: trypsin-like peptidase domain-containing protein [Sandaracinaceae bacterium]|nr:trypsin-like peptidase domain-containing protein [Sandaracinaceae bacterium]